MREWIHRLLGSLGRHRRDRELEQELQLHLELAAEDARKRGQSPDDARRAARIQLGHVSQAMEGLRDQRGLPWLDSLVRDVRLGARMLRKHAVVTAAAVVSLSLALGACVAAFSLVDALILRPLPVRQPGAADLPGVSAPTRPSGPRATRSAIPLFVRLRDAGARARRPLRHEHAGDAAGEVRRCATARRNRCARSTSPATRSIGSASRRRPDGC